MVTLHSGAARVWLLLHYKVAARPSARRVYIWRKLKRLGAVLLHDAVWVLPDTPRTREQFQWLAAEITEMGGEAFFWASRLAMGSDEALVGRFVEQVDADYDAILKQLQHKALDLAALSLRYQQVRQREYFPSRLGARVLKALTSARGGASR